MAIKSIKKSKKLGVVSKKKKIVSKKSRKIEVGLSPDKNFNRQSPSNLDSKKKSTKRVSFSNRIEAQSPEPPDSVKQVITPRSESLPSKGILRVKAVSNGAEITPKSTKLKNKLPRVKQDTPNFEAMEVDEPVMVKPKLRKSNGHSAKLDKKLPKFDAGVNKKPKLMVKKSLKEKLLEMDRRQRKAFIRALREKSRPNFHLAMEVKLSWEKLRSSKTPPNVKEDCIQKIMSTVKGHLKDLIYAHDTSRVVQCLMALKRDDIRKALFDELLPEIVRMTKSQYARFFVKKMLKYGTREQKDQIINAFQGYCVKIYRIVWAADVLEDAFNNHANAQQRLNILNEFYGKEYVLYKQSSPSLQLSEIIANDPAKKASIALNLEEALQPAVEKTTLKLSLTHKLLLEFFTVCSSEQRDNMVESLKDKIPEICITREGSRVGLFCVWNSKAAERKAIVKSFKGTLLNACKHEFAHRVLLGIFDCVDDTKLINKYILQEIGNYIADIVLEKYGQKVLHYLVNPRDPGYFFKGEQELYKQGDNNEHSKKPKEVRYKELFEYIQESLYTYLAANMKELVFNKVTSMLVLNSLELPLPTDLFKREVGVSYRSSCYQALAEVVGEEFIPHNIEGPKHIIESGCGRYILNNLLRADKQLQEIKLSDHLARLPKEHLASFIAVNNGCFVLKNMCESGSVTARNVVKSCVSIKALEKSPFVGAQWLLKELKKH